MITGVMLEQADEAEFGGVADTRMGHPGGETLRVASGILFPLIGQVSNCVDTGEER